SVDRVDAGDARQADRGARPRRALRGPDGVAAGHRGRRLRAARGAGPPAGRDHRRPGAGPVRATGAHARHRGALRRPYGGVERRRPEASPVTAGQPDAAASLCGRPVRTDRALIMAIVNRTPDSFYDRGAAFADGDARAAVRRAVDDGADIIDIGGVKAGPGTEVDQDEEIRRVVPFVAWVRENFPDRLISIDTWRGPVARRARAAGADLINDTWAGADPGLVSVAAETGAGLVCSHT